MSFLKQLDKEKRNKIIISIFFVVIFNSITYSTMNTLIVEKNRKPDPKIYDEFGLPRNQSQAVYLDIRKMVLMRLNNTNINDESNKHYIEMLKHIETNLLNDEYNEWKKFSLDPKS